jgi:two-component system chemotaxis response regulator CheY
MAGLIHILIVDDSKTVRKIIRKELDHVKNYLGDVHVEEAENGFKALELLRANPKIDIIISDWNMPEMDGLAFVEKLRSQSEYDNIPILMITVNRSKNDVMQAVKSGVNGYLIKPFKEDQLLRKIAHLLKYRTSNS